ERGLERQLCRLEAEEVLVAEERRRLVARGARLLDALALHGLEDRVSRVHADRDAEHLGLEPLVADGLRRLAFERVLPDARAVPLLDDPLDLVQPRLGRVVGVRASAALIAVADVL